MRSDRHRYAICFAGLLSALFVFQGLVFLAHAADVKALLNQVNKELRQVQRDMFGGKTEKAVASLEKIREKLLQAREADPNNPQVKSYEGKYEKLVKDLERRTGKDLGGGSLTAAGGSTRADLPPKPEAKPVEQKAAAPAPAQGEADDAEPPAKKEAPKASKAGGKAPPCLGATVGDSYYIRPSAVK